MNFTSHVPGLLLQQEAAFAYQHSASASLRYNPLTRPVQILLDAVTTPWRTVSFVAEAVLRPLHSGSIANSIEPRALPGERTPDAIT